MAKQPSWTEKYPFPGRAARREDRKAAFLLWRVSATPYFSSSSLPPTFAHIAEVEPLSEEGEFDCDTDDDVSLNADDVRGPPTHSQQNSMSTPVPPPSFPTQPRPTESDEDDGDANMQSVCDTNDGELSIVNGVGTAYGVPIYTSEYFDCAELKRDGPFPMTTFAELCIELATRKDSEIRKDQNLRPSRDGRQRRRAVVKDNEAPCLFVSGCPDPHYLLLFEQCFVSLRSTSCLKMNLDEYLPLAKRKERKKQCKRFVLFKRGFGVHRDFRHRLFILMSILRKWMVWGVLNVSKVSPPWMAVDGCGRLCLE